MNAGYRQVFTDGRPLPTDPNPSWQGYSSAKWSGDTLVIDTIGLRDDTWIDWNGALQCCENVEQDRRLSSGLGSGDGETMWWERILGLERRPL